jgi:ankyrin repeat protein
VQELALKFLRNNALASRVHQISEISNGSHCLNDNYIPRFAFHEHKRTIGIHLAARFGLHQASSLLISYDEPVGVRDDLGRSPLCWAALNGHIEVVKLLLDRDDVTADAKDIWGGTPLIYGAQWGRKELVKLLQDRLGVATNYTDHDGQTLLSMAAKQGNAEVVQYLLDQPSVEPDLPDS